MFEDKNLGLILTPEAVLFPGSSSFVARLLGIMNCSIHEFSHMFYYLLKSKTTRLMVVDRNGALSTIKQRRKTQDDVFQKMFQEKKE